MKKIIKIILSTFIIFASISIYVVHGEDNDLEGKGTNDDPYLISSKEDLIKMSSLVNNGDSYLNAHYKLTTNIDMAEIDFEPIGSTSGFSGVLDGNGYAISNLVINSTGDQIGLISFLNGGTVKNLGIESGVITGGNRTGALVGRTMYANIINCYSKADVNDHRWYDLY